MYRGHNRALYVSGFTKETSYDTAQAVDCELRVTSAPSSIKKEFDNDLNEVGGGEEITRLDDITQHVEIPLDQAKCRPNTLAIVAAFGMGAISSVQEALLTSYIHSITPLTGNNFDLPSMTIEEKIHSAYQKKFTGCFVDAFSLSVARKGFWNLSSTIFGSGTTASGSASPAAISETPMKAGDAKIWLGTGAYDGSMSQSKSTADIASVSDLSARIVNFNWGYNNNSGLDDNYLFNGGTVLGRAVRGRRAQTLTFDLEFDSTGSEIIKYIANTEIALEVESHNTSLIDAAGANFFGFNLVFPQLQITKADPVGGPNDTMTISCEASVMEDATYGSVLLNVYNAQAAYAG